MTNVFQKRTVDKSLKEFLAFYESDGSLLLSQQSVTSSRTILTHFTLSHALSLETEVFMLDSFNIIMVVAIVNVRATCPVHPFLVFIVLATDNNWWRNRKYVIIIFFPSSSCSLYRRSQYLVFVQPESVLLCVSNQVPRP